MCIRPKINFGPGLNNKLCETVLCQVMQNTGGPKIQNTDGAGPHQRLVAQCWAPQCWAPQTRRVYPRLDLINIDAFLPNID